MRKIDTAIANEKKFYEDEQGLENSVGSRVRLLYDDHIIWSSYFAVLFSERYPIINKKAGHRSDPLAVLRIRWGDTPTSPSKGDGCPFRPLILYVSIL